MAISSTQRAKFYWNCLSPYSTRLVLGYGVLAALTWVRDELLPETWKRYHVIDMLPAWPLYLWVAIATLLIAVALAEGALRQHHIAEEATAHSKPLINLRGIAYESVKKQGASRFIAPVLIVVIIAAAYFYWSFQQNASLASGDFKILGFQPHPPQDGKEARVNISYIALKPTHISMTYKVFVVNHPPHNIEDIRQLEEQFWAVTMTPRKGTEDTVAIPPDMEAYTTLRGTVMTSEQVEAWKAGNLSIYFMGKVKYSNDNGKGALDFCAFRPKPELMLMLCKNHNGPSASY